MVPFSRSLPLTQQGANAAIAIPYTETLKSKAKARTYTARPLQKQCEAMRRHRRQLRQSGDWRSQESASRERGLAFAEGVGDAKAEAETTLRRGVQVRAKKIHISARAEMIG